MSLMHTCQEHTEHAVRGEGRYGRSFRDGSDNGFWEPCSEPPLCGTPGHPAWEHDCKIFEENLRRYMDADDESPEDIIDKLARGVIRQANAAGFPRPYWAGDQDIQRALRILGWSVDQARTS